MSAQTIGEGDREAGAEAPEPVNEVRLAGRISAGPEERVLPSGDVLWTFRIVVPRPPASRAGVRAGVDALECAVWGGRVRRSVAGWGEGDLVEVTGAMRRRFFRTAAGAASRVEVEVTSGRLIRRAATG
jgi:single-strand DNA-binding protein